MQNDDPENIFNADETALYYKCPSNSTLILNQGKKPGGRFSKERITILLSCSQKGEKLSPLIIGRSKKPRWMKSLRSELDKIIYNSSNKA